MISGTEAMRSSWTLRCRAVVWAALWFSTNAANAALFEDDDARKAILDLRQKVELIQQRSAEELRKAGEETAQLNVQLQQLRRSVLELSGQIENSRGELARLRGQDEQFARELAEVQLQQKDLLLALQAQQDRVKKFEPSKVQVDGLEFVAEPAEIRDFEAALTSLRKGDFAQAQNAFADFGRRYPSSGYNPSALFWLGNAQYAQRDYKEAVINFRALMTVAPTHLRAPESLLSIANCQVELKDLKGARKTLDELIKSFPQSEAAKVGKERLGKLK
jgi:tol-pal system protein YbgF